MLLVDDHPLWRETLRMVFKRSKALRVIEARDGEEALRLARLEKPDVVVMDVDLPGMNGIEATGSLLAEVPGARVLMLSASDDRSSVVAALRAGACGYMLKTSEAAELLDAINKVHAGELVFPPALASVVLEEVRRSGARGAVIRVAVCSDSLVGREGLTIVAREMGADVLEPAVAASAMNDLVTEHEPDLLLIEISARGDSALKALHELRKARPGFPVLVLADDLESATVIELVSGDARAIGYLSKIHVGNVEDLIDAMNRIVAGEAVVDSLLVSRLVERQRSKDTIGKLTDRERQVLELMAEGRSNQAISEKLFLSPKTVETRVAGIFMKLALQPAADDHRRVLAVLAYLRASERP